MLYDFYKLQCLTKRFRTSHQISHHHKITTILCLFHENGVIIWLCYLSNASRGKESIGLATRKISHILTHTLTRCRNPENCTKKSYQVLFVDQFCTAVKTFFSKHFFVTKWLSIENKTSKLLKMFFAFGQSLPSPYELMMTLLVP